ncbi:hypothetical protein BDD12DRAFT_743025 [Trichophaea hybrida]|nr:hypothetical protein BDD12DRAFT_743025 [Trichophaea hybrida]
MSGPPPVNFGEELKVANGISWLDDIQAFYRERAAIEKEYAAKINALSRKYHEKKSRKSAFLSVGDTPQLTPGSLESASLTTWTTILTTTEALAAERDAFSTALTTQVADVLKSLATRYDDYRKRHESLSQKLLAERDGVYGDLKKTKVSYDAECKEVEEKRQKVDKSYDAGKTKAQRSYQTELVEMNNAKNTYLLQIEATNAHKKRYFHEDLPEIINSLQDLNETRVSKINTLWTLSTNLETTMYQNSIGHLSTQLSEIERNIPVLDSGMFLRHNITNWTEPSDFAFEASPIWHDNPDMVVDEPAQIYLRNILQKSRKGMEGLKTEVEKRGKEIQQLSENWDNVKLDESQAQKEIDVVRALLFCQEEILPHSFKLLTCQIETEAIIAAVGDVARGTQSHNFKSTTFKILTNCDLCSERIWGLTSKGFKCTDCGYACHSKCEMKVPAACPGVLDKAAKKALRDEKKVALKANGGSETDLSTTSGLSRANTSASTASTLAPPTSTNRLTKSPSISGASTTSNASDTPTPIATAPIRRLVAPPPDRYISAPAPAPSLSPPSTPTSFHAIEPKETGKMLYTFSSSSSGEVSVEQGAVVTIIDDDGGWMTVRRGDGEEGLVPTSYVEKIVKGKRGPPPPIKPRGTGMKKKKSVRALYAYEPVGDDEVGMREGEEFVVLERDVGGWVRVKTRDGEGLVPGTYVEDV